MTIKEFARLCACNTQTLRYYDKIDLLKPVQVDPWSGYRYYESAQAIDFIKIKNLQAADFSIQEIKSLLTQSDQQVYAAFDRKIAEQEHKLARIREIQSTYLAEKNIMEQIIYSMTDYIISQCRHPELLTEFGYAPSDAPAILACVRRYMNGMAVKEPPQGEVSMRVNGNMVQGEEAVLDRIHALSEENLPSTILLNTGFGHSIEHTADSDPDFSDYECIWERHGWHHAYEFLDAIPPLEPGRSYCLRLRTNQKYTEDLSYAIFLMGSVLYRQSTENIQLNCVATMDTNSENHFTLLRQKTFPV